MDRALTIIRFAIGLSFVATAGFELSLGLPPQTVAAVSAELIAGFALVAGLWTRWIAVSLAVKTVILAALGIGTVEVALLEVALLSSLAIGGPGAFAFDNRWFRNARVWQPQAIAVARTAVGLTAVIDGAVGLAAFRFLVTDFASEGFPAPRLAAVTVVFIKLIGGTALAAGLFTRWAAGAVAFETIAAAAILGLRRGVEFGALMAFVSIALAITRPNTFALDSARHRTSR